MASRLWVAAVGVVLLFGPALAAQEQEPKPTAPSLADQMRISELIKQLDAEKADQREAATAELRKIGAAALATLEKTLADPPSIEAKFRIQTAIDGIKLDLARRNALKIDDILAQAKAAQKEGWDKQTLQSQLERLIETLAAETGKKDLKLPVRFADLGQAPMGPFARGTLIKERRVKTSMVEGSIVLADSIAEVSMLRNSIVIAPVAAIIGSCENSLVVAGQLVNVSSPRGSVILCNSRLEGSFVRDSILAGPEGVQVSHAEGSTFVNSAIPMRPGGLPPGRAENKSVEAQGIVFGAKAPQSPLEGKLTITLATQQGEALALFKLPDGTGEFVARYEQEIKTPQGQPIESLQGWKLIYAGNRLAVFANGEEIACVRQGM
ncbi:MAG TPA: hypothetical protein VMP01_01750 [Pirellulaceae bacterium]|nr:hypothetical protein [Pirellulaceae bacterium]